MSFECGKLDLSGIDEDTGPSLNYIDVGNHVVKVSEASVKPCNNPAHKMVSLTLADESGKTMLHSFNVVNGNPKAVEIGKSQLKSFLIAAHHPTPDKPGDIGSLNGLKVKIEVLMGKPRLKDGVMKSYPEVKAFTAVGEPTRTLDDEIPF